MPLVLAADALEISACRLTVASRGLLSQLWAILERTYPNARRRGNWCSPFAMNGPFRRVANATASALELAYPHKGDMALSQLFECMERTAGVTASGCLGTLGTVGANADAVIRLCDGLPGYTPYTFERESPDAGVLSCGRYSKTHGAQRATAYAVMPAEVDQLPDLTASLNPAPIPHSQRVGTPQP